MAMHLLDESRDDSFTGSLIIQRKIKIKTLLYKFSFETTMTAVFLQYQDGMNSLVAYVIIHIVYPLSYQVESVAYDPGMGVVRSFIQR